MVIYDLQCALGHQFEGWFPSRPSYEVQLNQGLIHCSVCGNNAVHKLPSGGHVALHASVPAVKPAAAPHPQTKNEAGIQKEMQTNVDPVTLMKAVHSYVKQNFKNVGEKFADEAIEIHKGEKDPEPIFGTADKEQKERMEEEGVPYTSIPGLPEEFEN